jgi:hypothetical protein
MTLKKIVEHIEKCGFKDEVGHNIENHISFIELKRLAKMYPVLLGDELEVDVEGKIAGVRTSVKKKGRVLSLTLSSSERHTIVNAKVTEKIPSPYNFAEPHFATISIHAISGELKKDENVTSKGK